MKRIGLDQTMAWIIAIVGSTAVFGGLFAVTSYVANRHDAHGDSAEHADASHSEHGEEHAEKADGHGDEHPKAPSHGEEHSKADAHDDGHEKADHDAEAKPSHDDHKAASDHSSKKDAHGKTEVEHH